jgi:hypothetical protein
MAYCKNTTNNYTKINAAIITKKSSFGLNYNIFEGHPLMYALK